MSGRFVATGGAGRIRPPRGRLLDDGMVLLETALAIPLLVAVAMTMLGVGRVALDELAVVAAARDGALLASRGGSEEAVRSGVHRRLPSAATAVTIDGSRVTVRVQVPTSLVPGLGAVAVHHDATSVALLEPGVGEGRR